MVTRISGLASGLDTEELIKNLMKIENMRVDRLKQNVQRMEWTRDSYRDISNLLRGFKDEYFDVLKPDSNMRSFSAFSAFEAFYNGSTTSSYLTVKAGADASAGNYSIKEIITATTAKLTGGTLASGIKGTDISNFNISGAQDNNKVTVTFNGTSKVITIDDDISDIDALVDNLQTKINAAFGENKVTVGKDGSQLTFETDNTNTLSFSYVYNTGCADLLGKDLSEGIKLDNGNNKFKLTLGTDKDPVDIVLDPGDYENTDAIVDAIQTKIDEQLGADAGKVRVYNSGGKVALKAIDADATVGSTGSIIGQTITDSNEITQDNNEITVTIGENSKTINLAEKTYTQQELLTAVQRQLDKEFGSNKVLVTLDDSKNLRFDAISEEKLSTAAKENGGMEALGLDSANKSNKIDLKARLADIKDKFNTKLIFGDSDSIKFTINGEEFQFESTDSLSNIINQVNNNDKANVKMKYDQLNDRFVIESKQTGVTAKVEISDQSSNLMAVLGFSSSNNSAAGTDAKVEIDFNDGNGYQIVERSTNNFSINGLSFDLKQNFNITGTENELKLNINANPDKAVETITSFVEKYNEVLDKINEQLSQKRYRDYQPLTEEQKKEMSEKDIELWEEKAKSGLLRSDPLLDRIVNNMRSALYTEVEGVGISLYDIGIKTGSWEQRGKLVIDEEKLKAALTENPNQVAQLFSQKSDVSYTEAMDDSSKAKTRYAQSGLAERLYDIIQDNIRTTRSSSGQKGLLLEKAGIKNDGTEFDNLINDQIERENDRIGRLLDQLNNKENYYYNMFAQMEKAIQQMNSQSMWLLQQFGGGA
ncbi:flagellar filament capping protein FliD [Peptococcaceae bacterium 1198_IL3148]